jgi:hypothetical protein
MKAKILISIGSILSDAIDAVIISMRLNQIDDNRIADLRSILQTELDAKIVMLGHLIDWKRPSDAEVEAIRALNRISQDCATRVDQNADTNMERMIQATLQMAKDYCTRHSEQRRPNQRIGATRDMRAGDFEQD